MLKGTLDEQISYAYEVYDVNGKWGRELRKNMQLCKLFRKNW